MDNGRDEKYLNMGSSKPSTVENSKPQQQNSNESARLMNTKMTSTSVSYLADLYWKYPKMYEEIYAYPLHANQVLLSTARGKSTKIHKELSKGPQRNRLSKEDESIRKLGTRPPPKSVTEKKSTIINPGTHRTVNQAVVTNTKPRITSVSKARKGTLVNTTGLKNDPSLNVTEFQKSKGHIESHPHMKEDLLDKTKSNSTLTTDGKAPVILDAIRVQREDAKTGKLRKKCCKGLMACTSSPRFRCVAFFTIITIIIALCIGAIAYPIARAFTLDA